MGLFKTLFATPEMVKKAADGIYNGIDKAFLTDEEQADFWLKYLDATQPQNKARRLIALIVCGVWALFSMVVMFAIFFAEVDKRTDLIQFGTIYIMPPFTIITSWYFWKRIKK
jgi:hypothetical protein